MENIEKQAKNPKKGIKKPLDKFLAETNVSKTGLAFRKTVKNPLIEIIDMKTVEEGLYS